MTYAKRQSLIDAVARGDCEVFVIVLASTTETVLAGNIRYEPGAVRSYEAGPISFDASWDLSGQQVVRNYSGGVGQEFEWRVIERDLSGNILSVGDVANDKLLALTYDGQDRLASTDGSLLRGIQSCTYSYDLSGNRLEEGCFNKPITYTYQAGTNRLDSLSWPAEELVCGAGVNVTRSIARDSRGRALEGFRTKYPQEDARYGLSYEPSGRLGAVDVDSDGTADIFYAYDHLSRRLEKRSGTETRNFTYLGDSLLFEGDVNAGHQEYIYLQGRPIALVVSSDADPATSAEVFRLATDHLATPMRAFADDGTVVWAADYEAFGSVVEYVPRSRNAPQISVSLRFPGQVFDAETGLHYNGHRFYGPNTARYLEEDLVVRTGSTPAGVEQPAFPYALGSPLQFSDPDGRFTAVEAAIVAAIAVTLVALVVTAQHASQTTGEVVGLPPSLVPPSLVPTIPITAPPPSAPFVPRDHIGEVPRFPSETTFGDSEDLVPTEGDPTEFPCPPKLENQNSCVLFCQATFSSKIAQGICIALLCGPRVPGGQLK